MRSAAETGADEIATGVTVQSDQKIVICGLTGTLSVPNGTPLDTWHDHTLMRVAFPRLFKLVERFPGSG